LRGSLGFKKIWFIIIIFENYDLKNVGKCHKMIVEKSAHQ